MTNVIVFQGEFAVGKGANYKIKTPLPTGCNVLTLYDKSTQLGILAHFDDYVDIPVTLRKINEVLHSHQTSLSSGKFVAHTLGGTGDQFSKTQKQLLINSLKVYKIAIQILPLTDNLNQRPQIVLDLENGKHTFIAELDKRIEYIQQREYGEFNNFLDKQYGAMDGEQIPYFYGKLARRKESDIPHFQTSGSDYIQICRRRESMGEITLSLHPKRKVVPKQEEVTQKLHTFLLQLPKDPQTECLNSFNKQDFNLLLRQLSSLPRQFAVLKFMVQNRHVLGIHIYARGTKSGTAMDVAKKYKNIEAEKLLKKWFH